MAIEDEVSGERVAPMALCWRGLRVGTVVELWADMFWWHARWTAAEGPDAEAFLAQAEAGEDPEVVIGSTSPLRLIVTAATSDELELKNPG